MGIILSQQGAYPKAIDAFERALVLSPERMDVRFNYALALEKSGRLDEAIVSYSAILSDEPDYEDAAIHLADLYVLRGKTEQAILTLQGVVNTDRRAYQAALNLAALLERETRYEDALDALQVGAKGDGERSVLALFAAGRLYGRLGKLEDAKSALNTFLERWTGDRALAHRAEQMLGQLNID